MTFWGNGGNVLCARGGREPESNTLPIAKDDTELTEKEKKALRAKIRKAKKERERRAREKINERKKQDGQAGLEKQIAQMQTMRQAPP